MYSNSKLKRVRLLLLLAAVASLMTFLLFSSLAGAASFDAGVTDGPTADAAVSHRLIVQLASPALAERADLGRSPNGVLDLNSAAAQNYINQLQAEQAVFVADMLSAMPSASVASYLNETGQAVEATYQVVFNGVVVDPGATPAAEARQILAGLPGVKAVLPDRAHQPQLYASLPLINAPALWEQVGGQDNAGAGIKIASVDGGLHHAAPMFDGTGFDYPEGWPADGLGDAANNNGKIIASRAYFRPWDPPAPGDGNTWPGENGTSHGTHTGSTAGGVEVVADYLGITQTLSGVAPGAWMMSYRAFYASVAGDASAYDTELIAALEDMVLDGADVVNNSWGGGPGSAGGEFDPIDNALINAANAGVFVSMSTGNAGPGNGTTDHPSPNYINVAASTTDGTYAAGRLNVSAPEPVSPTLQGIGYGVAAFGPSLPIGDLVTHNFVTSQSIDSTNVEGCSPWPAGSFTGKAAVISRGSCPFGDKVFYAQDAGADFVVIYNNAGDDLLNMAFSCTPGCSESDITISSIFIGQSYGEGMVDWYADNGDDSELEVDTFAFQNGNTPDIIADFSSRGPGVGNVLKPDIAAPGVNIMAQGYAPGASGEDRHLGFGQVSGTSMAAPHVTGAAAMMRQLYPDWSNAAIKSALMSTSKYMDIYNGDGSPAQPLDMGAGRLDLTNAADPGVILDPPSLSFGLVPTGTSKTMDVMVTSVADEAETYTLSTLYTGAGFAPTETMALPGYMVMPTEVTLDPGESAMVTVSFDSAAGQGVGDNQGFILMEGDNGHDAHMPAWARVTPPPAEADVLLIDNDFSSLLGFPDYTGYYTQTLESRGVSYDVWEADAYYGNAASLPEAAVLSSYETIIYFTGDNYYPDGSFTVPTPLTEQDMNRLTEFANNGGKLIAMGQDLAAVWNSDSEDDGEFAYNSILGATWLQDSVTGYYTPTLPVGTAAGAPPAFNNVLLDLTDPAVTGGDGAGNQLYIDELRAEPGQPDPNDPTANEPYMGILQYPGPFNLEDGLVAVTHRQQPSLEEPSLTYLGRSAYTSFGLEGVNNNGVTTSREELLGLLMDWAMDEPTVEISDATGDYSGTAQVAVFEANLSSNIAGTMPVSYRWDFGDGSPYVPSADATNFAGHDYEYCGTYTVRAEVTDSWGNRAIGEQDFHVTQNCTTRVYMPVILAD